MVPPKLSYALNFFFLPTFWIDRSSVVHNGRRVSRKTYFSKSLLGLCFCVSNRHFQFFRELTKLDMWSLKSMKCWQNFGNKKTLFVSTRVCLLQHINWVWNLYGLTWNLVLKLTRYQSKNSYRAFLFFKIDLLQWSLM